MAGADLKFACDCNTLRGTLVGASPRSGNYAVCFCHDCRAAEVYAGQPDPSPNPVGVFQTVPHKIRIDNGADQLSVFSFSDQGILRWQAQCCGAPLFNTLRRPKMAFAGVIVARVEGKSQLGPIMSQGFVRKANGKRGHKGLANAVLNFAWNAIMARVSGNWKQTSFFDIKTGEPTRKVHVVTDAERAALELSVR